MKAVREKQVQQSSLKTILETLDQDQVSVNCVEFSLTALFNSWRRTSGSPWTTWSRLEWSTRWINTALIVESVVLVIHLDSYAASFPANVEPSADKEGILLALPYCHHRECHRSPGWGRIWKHDTVRKTCFVSGHQWRCDDERRPLLLLGCQVSLKQLW